MNLEQQRKILDGATKVPWKGYRGVGLCGVSSRSEKCQISISKLDPSSLPETHDRQEIDCKAIAMMRNHYEAMLDLAEAVKQVWEHGASCNMAIGTKEANDLGCNCGVDDLQEALKRIESIGE